MKEESDVDPDPFSCFRALRRLQYVPSPVHHRSFSSWLSSTSTDEFKFAVKRKMRLWPPFAPAPWLPVIDSTMSSIDVIGLPQKCTASTATLPMPDVTP